VAAPSARADLPRETSVRANKQWLDRRTPELASRRFIPTAMRAGNSANAMTGWLSIRGEETRSSARRPSTRYQKAAAAWIPVESFIGPAYRPFKKHIGDEVPTMGRSTRIVDGLACWIRRPAPVSGLSAGIISLRSSARKHRKRLGRPSWAGDPIYKEIHKTTLKRAQECLRREPQRLVWTAWYALTQWCGGPDTSRENR